MAAKRKSENETILETLQNILIVQLALAGLDNHTIARIAGVHVRRVAPVATAIKRRMKKD